jgi:hypothetical protein
MSGGNRKGAGRKPAHPLLKKEPMPLKLPRWLINKLNEEPESRAVLIEEALKQVHGWKKPEVNNG